MKFEIENFITKLNSIKCSESIEFRSRFQKTWLKYLVDKNQKTEKELLRMMFEYQKFLKVSQQADSQIRLSSNKK